MSANSEKTLASAHSWRKCGTLVKINEFSFQANKCLQYKEPEAITMSEGLLVPE